MSRHTDAIVYCAEYINAWAFDHWQLFSTQNYFDPSGLFVTVVLSLPLCLISLITVILGLYNTSQLVIKVKAFEFKKALRRKKTDTKKEQ